MQFIEIMYLNTIFRFSKTSYLIFLIAFVLIQGVSPQELEGLHTVLLLIRTVAEHDEFSRLALCEHPGWSPLTNLLGLVSCSIPIPLKADLLLTLAALSKSSENAAQMWENLEASQILVTIPSTSSYAPRGKFFMCGWLVSFINIILLLRLYPTWKYVIIIIIQTFNF